MARRDHRHRHIAQPHRAAAVEAHDLDPLGLVPPADQIVDADDGDPPRARDLDRIGRMIGVAMRHEDRRRPRDRLDPARLGEHRIAPQPRIDQQHLIADRDAKSRMPEPGDLHCRLRASL